MIDYDIMIAICSALRNIAAAVMRTPLCACAAACALAAAGVAICHKILFD